MTYADKRESIFKNLKKGQKNYFFGDDAWMTYTRNQEERFKGITFDQNSRALRSINQDGHLKSVFDLVKKKDFDNIFIHIHEFDAAVHLETLVSKLAIKKLEKT